MKSIFAVVVGLTVLVLTPLGSAQESKPSIAVGANIGLQHPFCDIDPAGVSLAGEGQLRFLLSDRFNLALGLGYGQLSDGFSKRTFTTNVLNIDLKGNLYLLTSGAFRPYATLGFGEINHTYHIEKPWAKGDPALDGKPFWSTIYLFGGGFDFYLSKSVALTATADYRFTSTDELDGYKEFGQAKDGYLNGRVGLVFLLGKKAKTAPAEELIADRGVTTQAEEPVDEETAAILRNLGVFEDESPSAQPSAPAVAATDQDLEQRVQSLRLRIGERDQDIASLQSQIRLQDERIAELQRELTQLQQSPVEFSSSYQQGLRHFSTRNYDQAIAIFTALFNGNPQHKLASNCIYWVGESQFAKGNYQAAIDAFTQVFNDPNSFKLDDATLMLGRCHQKLGQIDKARNYFRQVIDKYPNSEYVTKAQMWLGRL